MEPLVVGVDVGGTKVLAGEVDRDGRVLRTALRRTPARTTTAGTTTAGTTTARRVGVTAVEDALTDAVLAVADGRELAGVGLAAAGFVDRARERVMFAPHLPWLGDPVRARMAERWGVPVALDNDANVAALAEGAFGSARGASSALVITMGTGIGGAILVDGQLWRGASGMAGEFGHQQVVPDGLDCECGQRGCWEQYSSGSALVRLARDRVGSEPTVLDEACGGQPELLTGPMVTAAAEDGDLVARQAFASVGDWLGVGLAGLVAGLDPEVVVVGGGVSAAGDRLLGPARAALARSLVGGRHRVVPPIRAASLGPAAGLIGAALLVRSEV